VDPEPEDDAEEADEAAEADRPKPRLLFFHHPALPERLSDPGGDNRSHEAAEVPARVEDPGRRAALPTAKFCGICPARPFTGTDRGQCESEADHDSYRVSEQKPQKYENATGSHAGDRYHDASPTVTVRSEQHVRQATAQHNPRRHTQHHDGGIEPA